MSDRSANEFEFLRGLPIFSNLNESSVRLLASACRFQRMSKREILFFYSDPVEAAYVIGSGRVSLVLYSPDGREMVIDELRAGKCSAKWSCWQEGRVSRRPWLA